MTRGIMPAKKLLAKIHVAKKELALDDETYREILHAEFGVQSSKFLDNSQALKLIHIFKKKGWQPKSKPKKYDDQEGDVYSATPKQKRLIEALWHEISYTHEEAKSLREFLFKTVKVSDLRFLTKRNAYDVIEAIKNIQARRHKQKRAL